MTGRSAVPRAPAGLATRGRALWRRLHQRYELDPVETELVHELCRVVDRCDRIAAELQNAELTVPGSTGQQRPNPLFAVLENEERVLDRLASSLGVSMPGESGTGRGAGHQRKAGRVRATRAGKAASVTRIRGA